MDLDSHLSRQEGILLRIGLSKLPLLSSRVGS